MFWILPALVSPIFHGLSNVLDSYLSNKLVSSTRSLVFYSALFNALFLPLLFFFGLPQAIPLLEFPMIITIAALEVVWLVPYFLALQYDDTSIVAALFSLGRIFVPIFAFFLIGEELLPRQYIGFMIVIFAAALLTIEEVQGMKFNKSFMYMFVASAIVALLTVLYKDLFTTVDWLTGFFWTRLFSTLFVVCLLFHTASRKKIKKETKKIKKLFGIFTLVEFLGFGGMVGGTFALTLAPATLVEAVDSIQPMFVLIYALILGKFFPHMFKENIEKSQLQKKVVLFAVMFVGIIIIL